MDLEHIYKPTVPKMNFWKLSNSGELFNQIFRKYFQKRSRRRKNGLKRVYNEGDMIFASLTTKTIFLKIFMLLDDFRRTNRGVRRNLEKPSYQKYISTY